MRRQWAKRVLIAAVVVGAAAVLFSGRQGPLTFYRTWIRTRQLRREIDRSNAVVDSLKEEIRRLQHDTAHIERIAREKYGMAKKNEKMYKFVEEK